MLKAGTAQPSPVQQTLQVPFPSLSQERDPSLLESGPTRHRHRQNSGTSSSRDMPRGLGQAPVRRKITTPFAVCSRPKQRRRPLMETVSEPGGRPRPIVRVRRPAGGHCDGRVPATDALAGPATVPPDSSAAEFTIMISGRAPAGTVPVHTGNSTPRLFKQAPLQFSFESAGHAAGPGPGPGRAHAR